MLISKTFIDRRHFIFLFDRHTGQIKNSKTGKKNACFDDCAIEAGIIKLIRISY